MGVHGGRTHGKVPWLRLCVTRHVWEYTTMVVLDARVFRDPQRGLRPHQAARHADTTYAR
jgi:hypothetical protein